MSSCSEIEEDEEYIYDEDASYEKDTELEFDYICDLFYDIKNRFPYFHSNITTFTEFILYLPKYENVNINKMYLEFYNKKYYRELQLTFNIINHRYKIDKESWLRYCYLYNN
jgi:hypothetical protein